MRQFTNIEEVITNKQQTEKNQSKKFSVYKNRVYFYYAFAFSFNFILLGFANLSSGQTNQFFAGDGSALSASKWGSSAAGPFTSAFGSGNIANFAIINGTGSGGTGITLGGVIATENFTLTPSGTLINQSNGVITIDVSSGKTLDFGAQTFTASGTAGYVKNNSGVLAMAGNTYGGGFTLNAGTIVVRGINAMGTGALTLNGGIVAANNNRDLSGKYSAITIGGNIQFGDVTLPAVGTSNLTFSNNMALGSSNRTFTLGGSGIITFGGIISNTGSNGVTFTANVNGTGRFDITNTGNTFSGPLTLNGGEVRFTDPGSFGNSLNTIAVDGGVLSTSSGTSYTLAFTHAIQVSAAAANAISVTTSGTLTYDGVISDKPATTGAWAKQGLGSLALGGVSTYSGATTINSGTLQLTTGNDRLPTGTVVNMGQASSTNVGTFNLNGRNQQIAGLVSIAGTGNASKNTVTSSTAATLTIGGSGSYVFSNGTTTNSGIITGAISIVKTGVGIQTLGDANTYSGTTTITEGELRFNPGANQTLSGSVNLNGGTLGTSGITAGRALAFSTLNLTDNSTIDLSTANSHTITFAPSNLVSWTSGKILTITNWQGAYNSTTGTKGQLFFGSSGLTASQIAQVRFKDPSNNLYYATLIGLGGELVPTNCTVAPSVTSVGSNSPICSGSTLNLSSSATGTAPLSYSWTGPNGFTSTLQNPSISSATTSASGTYTVTVSNACSSTNSIVPVTVNQTPTASASSNSPVVSGSFINLSSSGGSSYSWSGPNGFSSTQQNPVIYATTAKAGTYSVTVTGTGGCSSTAQTNVVVNLSNPTFSCYITNEIQLSPTIYQFDIYLLRTGTAAFEYAGGQWGISVNSAIANGGTLTSSIVSASSQLSNGSQAPTTALPLVLAGGVYYFNVAAKIPPGPGNGSIISNINGGCSSRGTRIASFQITNSVPFTANSTNNHVFNFIAAANQTQTEIFAYVDGINSDITSQGTFYSYNTVNTCLQNIALNCDLSAIAVSTGITCFGGANGTVSVTASGGTASYTYLWSNGRTTTQITGLTAGAYFITVHDSKTCTATASVTVTQPSLIVPSISGTLSFCAGNSTSINTASYAAYLWSPNGQTTQFITASAGGVYSVTVTDANGCTGSASAALTQNALPTPSISGTLSFCAGGSTTLNTSSNAAYLWSPNGQTTQFITASAGGVYSVTVTDANGCSGSTSAPVTQNALPTPSISGTLSFCAGGSTTLNTASYAAYLWSPNGQTTQSITASAGGVYSVTVTDVNGCTGSASATVTQNALPTPSISGSLSFCAGGSTTLSTSSYASYLWSPNGQTTQSITASAGGVYSVTVTDANGCTGSASATVTQNALPTPSISGSLSFCAGGSTTLSTSSYLSYLWSPNGQTTQSITASAGGVYSVTVTDVNGCTGSASATVTQNALPNPSISGTLSFCAGGSTSLNTASYAAYLWSPNGQTTQSIIVFTGDVYSVTVSDASGCTGSASVTVTQNALPTPSISSSLSFCAGSSTTLNTSSYTAYLWSPNGQTTQSITASAGGVYSVTVTDANGCTGSASATVTQNALPTPSISGSLSFCAGGSTTLSTSSYVSYLWSPNGQTTQSITASAGGVYSVTVTDVNGCTGSASATVTQNALPNPSISGTLSFCAGGSTSLNTASYAAYLWSPNGQTTQSIIVFTGDVYSVTVSDASGCTGSASVTVTQNALPTPSISSSLSFCAGSSTTLNTSSYAAYLWSPNGQTTQSITASAGGIYSVTVTDANGCTGSASATVTQNALPTPSISSSLSFCAGSSTTLNTSSYTAYLWSPNGQTTQSITASAGGVYSVTVTDANGCTGSASATITQNALPTPTISGSLSFCAGSSTTLNTSSYTAYLWSPNGQTTQFITASAGGVYSVTVTDANGCTGSASATVTQNALPTPSISGTLSFCAGSSTTLNTASYAAYLWSPNGQTTQSITASAGGVYLVTVTDANGCTGSVSATVTQNALPTPSISGTLSFCAGSSTTLNTSSYTAYLWSPNGQTTQSITASAGGIYSVRVTDANSCTGSASATVTQNALPTPSISGSLTYCAGGSTTLNAGSYASYLWSPNGETTQTITAIAGTYSVSVTDANGCKGSASVTVTESTSLIPVIFGDRSFCTGNSTTLNAGSYASYLWSPNGETTQAITASASGVYSVTVSDASGCTGSASATVTENALPTPAVSGNLSFCAGGATAIGTGNYAAYLWSPNGETTQAVLVTSGGIYFVAVTDANGCTGSASATVTQNALPAPSISGTLSFCAGGSTTLNTASYAAYLWSPNGQTTQSITASAGGVYSVTVTDVNGCTGSASATVTQNALPTPSISGSLSFCAGGSTTLSTSSYASYLWSPNGQTTQSITASAGGVYSVTVTDANGCTGSASATVTQNALPTPSISGSLSFCAGGSTTLSTSSYLSYLWSPNGQTTQSITASAGGVYSVTVTDVNGCTGSASATVTQNALPNPSISGTLSFCAGGSTSLNTASYAAYLWSPNGQTTQSIIVFTGDVYSVTVSDASGCTGSASVTVTQNALPTPSISSSLSFCAGSSTTLNTSSYTAYLWSPNGQTTQSITASAGGVYSVTVTDANGCTGSASATVTQNALPTPSISGSLSFCAGGSTTLSTSSYVSYLWSPNGQTTQSITASAGGVYSVTVTDVNGCTGSASATVTQNALPNPSISGTLSFCAGGSTSLNTASYAAYLWSPNGQTTQSIIVFTGDVYSVTVSDASGCTGSASVTVTQNALPTPSISSSLSFCAGSSTTLNTSSYTAYLWSPNGQTTQSITASAGGVYSVTVTDANGCTGSASATITQNALPTPSISGSLTYCAGGSTTLNAGSYASYLWSPNGETTQTITAIAGTYSVSVTDANGCKGSASVTVTESTSLIPVIFGDRSFCTGNSTTLNAGSYASYLWSPNGETTQAITASASGVYSVTVSDASGCTGSASATVTENALPTPAVSGNLSFCAGGATAIGTGNYAAYLWSPNGETTQAVLVTSGGIYFVAVTDANGCTGSASATVTQNALPAPSISGTLSFCAGGSTTLNTASYAAYLWSPNGQTTQSITASAGGVYSVTVTDVNGCTGSASATVTQNALPTPSISGSLSFCAGGSTTLSTSSYASYLWSPNGQTTQSITASAGGVYSVTVTDANGCTGSASATVTQNALPTPSISGSLSFCAGGSTTLSTSSYLSYLWSPNGQTTQSITASAGGVYSVTVTDVNGCTGSASATVTQNALPNPSISGTLSFCAGGSTSLNTASYAAYLWSPNGQTTQSIIVFTGDVYSVTVSDASGCTGSASVTVTQNALPTPSISSSLSFCAGSSTTLNTSSYTAYLWSPNGQTTQSITASAGGVYSVTVTDANGCTGSASATVTQNALPTPSISGSLSFCAGGSTTLSTSSYVSYLWSPNGQTTQSITASAGGVYSVTVTDVNGCTGSASATVTQNALPNPSISGTLSFCAGGSTSLNTASYAAYLWSPNGQTTQSIIVFTGDVYSVTVSDASGCTGSASVTVTQNALPTPSISSSLSFCAGSSTTLNTSSYTAYLWSPNGQTTQSITASAGGVYSVTVTDANGCTGSASATVTQNASPVPSISGSLTFCAGGSTTIGTGNYDSYSWSPGGQTTQTIIVYAGGTYSVTVTNANGCSGYASAIVSEISCGGTVTNLKLFIEGYYLGGGQMRDVMRRSLVTNATATQTDIIEIVLRDPNFPAIGIDSMITILMTDGLASVTFNNSIAGNSYWILVRHRSALETWSATPVAFTPVTTYDFTNDSTKAYAHNMKFKYDAWTFYNGDINHDTNTDLVDFPDLDAGVVGGYHGYYNTDLNGDGNVDLMDFPILDENIVNGVWSVHP